MGHFNNISRTYLVKKCLFALAACGLIFPGAGVAQSETAISDPLPKQTPTQGANRSTMPVLTDGNYLFGQSKAPGQMGSTYAVFSVVDNQTIGAFYQPRSSFDCFSGQMSPSELSVNIVDSYDQTVYPYEVAVSVDNTLAAGNTAGAYALDGFHRIDELSEQDYEMLAVCQADFAK